MINLIMLRIALVVCFVFTSLLSQGQSLVTQISIDDQLKTCLDSAKNQTTAGIINCTHKAKDAWDKELNKYYKQLMTKLNADEKEKLKTAQINWLAYRDSEYLFSGTAYRNLQGTMWLVVNADRQMQIVKSRALELKSYSSILNEAK